LRNSGPDQHTKRDQQDDQVGYASQNCKNPAISPLHRTLSSTWAGSAPG
jgi:hypothetical protein